MKIVFFLYKNALARHTYGVTVGQIEYKLIAKFPYFMYDEVKKVVELYQDMNGLVISMYEYITVEESGFAESYGLEVKKRRQRKIC